MTAGAASPARVRADENARPAGPGMPGSLGIHGVAIRRSHDRYRGVIMRTILLGALAVAVLATPATARELPADILGKWCMTGEDENRSTGLRAEAKEDCGDGSLTIG